MEMLRMDDPPPMTLPLLPAPGQAAAKPAPLKADSLSRMEELQQYLRQCDDQQYLKNYIKVLSSMPRDLLEDLTRQLKARSAWLSAEEQREYKRAKVLNVMGGGSCGAGSPGRLANAAAGLPFSPGRGMGSLDADAFCYQVLEGGSGAGGGGCAAAAAGQSGGGGDAAAAGAAAAEEDGGLQGADSADLEILQQLQHFMTPAEAPRTKMRVLPPPASEHQQGQARPAAGVGSAVAADAGAAAGEPRSAYGQTGTPSDASPDDLAGAAGILDHQLLRISPEQQPALTPVQQRPSGKGSGRVWQPTLLTDKL